MGPRGRFVMPLGRHSVAFRGLFGPVQRPTIPARRQRHGLSGYLPRRLFNDSYANLTARGTSVRRRFGIGG